MALGQIAAGDVDVVRDPAVNERQTFELTGGATGGTFRLGFDGDWTDPIRYNATATDIYFALAKLPAITLLGVSVSQESQDCVQEIRVVGEPTKGTFTITLDGQTTDPLPYNASNLKMAYELTRLPVIGAFNINVTGAGLFGGGPWWKIAFQGPLAGVRVNRMTADASGLSGGVGIAVNTKILTPGGRKFTITFGGGLTGFNVPQLVADTSMLTGGVKPGADIRTVNQGSWPYTVTFEGNLSGKDVPQLVGDASGLTGGKSPTVTWTPILVWSRSFRSQVRSCGAV